MVDRIQLRATTISTSTESHIIFLSLNVIRGDIIFINFFALTCTHTIEHIPLNHSLDHSHGHQRTQQSTSESGQNLRSHDLRIGELVVDWLRW